MKKIIMFLISGFILCFGLLFIILPKKEFSSNENRFLEKQPLFNVETIINGKFMSNFENYLSDHFPFRETFLSFKTSIFKMFGVSKQNGVFFGDDGYLIGEYESDSSKEKIVRIVNNFVNKNRNINYQFMLVPTSIYINEDKLNGNSVSLRENDTIKYYEDNLDFSFINVNNILLEHNGEDLYYKTDHHWTTKGAYYAYLEFCRINGLSAYNYSFKMVSSDFYGTLYSKVLDKSINKDEIYIIDSVDDYSIKYYDRDINLNSLYNEEYLKKKDKYAYFLDDNHSLITITNNSIQNNQELLIIKDSYANCFIPFLINHYQRIHVIDPRYYHDSISDYINTNNLNQVLFLYNVITINDDLGILSIK